MDLVVELRLHRGVQDQKQRRQWDKPCGQTFSPALTDSRFHVDWRRANAGRWVDLRVIRVRGLGFHGSLVSW